MADHSPLPKQFNSLDYVETMQTYVSLEMDKTTCQQVSQLMDVAYNMAKVVFDAPIDDNHFDLANVYTPGKAK